MIGVFEIGEEATNGANDEGEKGSYQGGEGEVQEGREEGQGGDVGLVLRAYRLSAQAWADCYAARVLGCEPGGGRRGKRRRGVGRRKKYGLEVLAPLKRVWAVADGMCGKSPTRHSRFGDGARLSAIPRRARNGEQGRTVMPEMVEKLERFGEMRLDGEVRTLLTGISASTIDRLLAPERKKMQLKGESGTKSRPRRRRVGIPTLAEPRGRDPAAF